MNTTELCASAGLTQRELQSWIDYGLLEPADIVGRAAGGGLRREFTPDQARAGPRPQGAAHTKVASLSQLARANLTFDGQAFIVFDGKELRACRDAAAAIGAVVRAQRPCSAVDLSAIRTDARNEIGGTVWPDTRGFHTFGVASSK
jgi:hypothetical protein